MTNPTTLVSTFDGSLDASMPSGDTTWTVSTGDEEYTATSPAQFALTSADTDAITIDPTDVLDPVQGSLAFWFKREIDSGGTESLLQVGIDGAGTDWLRVLIASDQVMFWLNAEGDLPTHVSSTVTLALSTMYFVYCEWTRTTMAVSVNGEAKVVTSRAAVAESWGASDLTLEAA